MINRIFGHSLLYTLANHVPLIANIVVLPLITPFLTKEDYGIYGLTYAYIGAFHAFSMLGIEVLFSNTFFKNPENYKTIWSKYIAILIIWRIIYALLIALILYGIFSSLVKENIQLYLCMVLVPILFFDITKSIGTKYCQYKGSHQIVYISSFIASVFTIFTSFICIYHYRLGYMGFFIAAGVASLVQFIFYFFILHIKLKIYPDFRISKTFIFKTLKVGIPVVPHNYANFVIESSDKILLDLNGISIKKIGGYNLAYNFSNYFGAFNLSMNSILVPIYYKCFSLNDKKTSVTLINSITLLWFSFLLISSLLICIWCKEIISILYNNPEFQNIYTYVPFLVISLTYRPLYIVSVVKSIYLEKTKSILKISLIAALINITVNLLFIPIYGIKTILFSTFISYLYMGFSGFYFSDIKKNIDFSYNPIIFLVLMITTLILSLTVLNLNLSNKIVMSLIILLGCIFIYKSKFKKLVINLNNENLLS